MGPGRHAVVVLAVATMLGLAGCAAFAGYRDEDTGQLGREGGYRYDETLSVTLADGLNASERRAVVARTMARVERIRRLEFTSHVPVTVITREQYRERRQNGTANRSVAFDRWNDQVWEAIFIVSERRDVEGAMDAVLGTSVQGFYSPSNNRIVIVSSSTTPTIDRSTLAHELVHALQDQQFGLGAGAETQDGQLAADGLVEGDATVVEREYEERCGTHWSCLDRPQRSTGGGGGGTDARFDFGLFLTIYAPYAEGPAFIDALRARGGWSAVDAAYEDYPASTEQVIHPRAYPDEQPQTVEVPDRSTAAWKRFDVSPVYDTVGEASIYAMFWANGQIDRIHRSPYNYSHPLSTGWEGDRIVPYHSDGRYGYVWTTVWETVADARAFTEAYRRLLENHDASRDGNVYVIPESNPYGDAFRVERDGRTVVVTNAPSKGLIDDVHAPANRSPPSNRAEIGTG